MHYRSNIFIFTGLLSGLVLWLAKDLIYQYQNYDTELNLLPITLFEILLMALFLLAFVLICVTAVILAKRGQQPIRLKKRFHFLIPSFVGWIILYLLVDARETDMVATAALLLFGLILLNLNRLVTSPLTYFSLTLVVLGILNWFFKGQSWLFLGLGFGLLPLLFGTYLRFKPPYKPST